MNINKNFLTEVIKYLISKGVTVHDVLDAFHAEFEYHEQAIRKPGDVTWVDFKQPSVEENSTPCATVDSNRDLCQKVEKNAENTEKPVSKSWIDYPKTVKNHGNGVSPARKALFDVVGDKTVIEHLRANGIDYKVYDNRVRRKWSVADACTTPLAPRGRHKRVIEEPGEPETAVIIPDSVKVVEETSPKTKMMLVSGRMTEIKVSDTDLVQSSIIEKPEETLETKTETLETESNTENPTESVTNATELNGNNVTAVILDTPNLDAIRKDKDDNIEKALKKFVTHTEESKKDKKPKEAKKDYTVTDVCYLDRKIKDEYTPLTCFTSDFIMRDFIGKECYFSDNAYDFTDLSVFEDDEYFKELYSDYKGQEADNTALYASKLEEVYSK